MFTIFKRKLQNTNGLILSYALILSLLSIFLCIKPVLAQEETDTTICNESRSHLHWNFDNFENLFDTAWIDHWSGFEKHFNDSLFSSLEPFPFHFDLEKLLPPEFFEFHYTQPDSLHHIYEKYFENHKEFEERFEEYRKEHEKLLKKYFYDHGENEEPEAEPEKMNRRIKDHRNPKTGRI